MDLGGGDTILYRTPLPSSGGPIVPGTVGKQKIVAGFLTGRVAPLDVTD